MRIFFSLRHSGTLRNFASTILELQRRGHEVHLEFLMQDALGDSRLLDQLAALPGFTWGLVPSRSESRLWLDVARQVRLATDYVRYETPEYAQATALRDRAARRLRRPLSLLFTMPGGRSRAGLALTRTFLAALEDGIPADPPRVARLQELQPDVVLVTPLVDIGSDQVDYVKAARVLGIPSALCVHSWDNLTNKGLIRVLPDRVMVWNEAQKREAIEMHGCRPEQVVVTGAMVYDQWFARKPSTTRAEFCAKTGLREDRPFFLYLCSSQFIAPDEAEFVEEWVAAVRCAPDAQVRGAGILIRPHPENFQPWKRYEFSRMDNVVLWPREGASPVDTERRNDFYDSMYHAAAAIGINTSAQIESGIVGRPVFSIRVKRYEGTQEGTLHFHHLLNQGDGGLLTLAGDLDEHVRQLASAVDPSDEERRRLRRFVEAFVRPVGWDVAATPRIVDAIESLARQPRSTPGPSAREQLLRVLPLPLAAYTALSRLMSRLRIPEKRKWQLHSLSTSEVLTKPLFALLDLALSSTPIRKFTRKHIVPRVLPPQMLKPDVLNEDRAAVPRMIRKMGVKQKPLIVGPWLNDPETELLCWIPFVRWALTHAQVDQARVVVVSRSGTAKWYAGIAGRYIELLDFYTPEQFSERNAERIVQTTGNPFVLSKFDRDIMKAVQQAVGTRETESLHPRLMYRLLLPYADAPMSAEVLEQHGAFAPMQAPDSGAAGATLPRTYVAASFRFTEALPDTTDNRLFVREILSAACDASPVVLLDPPGPALAELLAPLYTSGRLLPMPTAPAARAMWDLRTTVIAGARAFVGSHEANALVAGLLGVPAVAFYSEPQAREQVALATRVFSHIPGQAFSALHVADVSHLRQALGDCTGVVGVRAGDRG